ncbi:MAG: Ig-like domain-containing protein [Pirellulaceae bacterium]
MISVNEVNDSPSATNDSPTASEDTPVTFNPLANDTDVDGTLDGSTVVLINPPAGATLSPDGKTLTVPGEGVYTVLPTGEITFSPAANFSGMTTSVTYQVADNDGANNFCDYFDFSE